MRRDRSLPVLEPEKRHDPQLSTVSAVRAVAWAAATLGLRAPPIYVDAREPTPFEIVPALPPALRIGAAMLAGQSAIQLAFHCARQLTWFREEHFVCTLVPSIAYLEELFLAALSIGAPEIELLPEVRARVAVVAEAILPVLDAPRLARLEQQVARFLRQGGKTSLRRWAQSAEWTALRAGLLMCGDLGTACDVVAAEANAADRVRELERFWASDDATTLRRELGDRARRGDPEAPPAEAALLDDRVLRVERHPHAQLARSERGRDRVERQRLPDRVVAVAIELGHAARARGRPARRARSPSASIVTANITVPWRSSSAALSGKACAQRGSSFWWMRRKYGRRRGSFVSRSHQALSPGPIGRPVEPAPALPPAPGSPPPELPPEPSPSDAGRGAGVNDRAHRRRHLLIAVDVVARAAAPRRRNADRSEDDVRAARGRRARRGAVIERPRVRRARRGPAALAQRALASPRRRRARALGLAVGASRAPSAAPRDGRRRRRRAAAARIAIAARRRRSARSPSPEATNVSSMGSFEPRRSSRDSRARSSS